ncbi:Protein of unknown function [Pyronema omphalodes CBS 100304]|uniref:Uncharacterized protein n=1 Tax=Pyronema omphalodes (strain CBS 100304) TaxID=1076935 RepID=U4KVN3_PYROM|nr:Protein of unknown function [Pyronema omphalodes CBS 100304]
MPKFRSLSKALGSILPRNRSRLSEPRPDTPTQPLCPTHGISCPDWNSPDHTLGPVPPIPIIHRPSSPPPFGIGSTSGIPHPFPELEFPWHTISNRSKPKSKSKWLGNFGFRSRTPDRSEEPFTIEDFLDSQADQRYRLPKSPCPCPRHNYSNLDQEPLVLGDTSRKRICRLMVDVHPGAPGSEGGAV